MRRRGERGFTTIQYVVATGFSLLLFVMVANLLVDLYDRGAMRDALDEGVRAGVPTAASADDCIARTRAVVASIASGSSLQVDDIECVPDGARIVATARIRLRSWFPMLLPDWRMTLRAAAERER